MAKISRTVSNTVYDILHRNIINLNLVPGSVMSEKDISEKMQVSRTPVREAFIRLSNVGLVEVVPQKGSMVSKISISRVNEERFLRESLELSVLEELIHYKKDINFREIRRVLSDQKDAMESGDSTRFIELDDFFHFILFREAGKSLCYDVVVSFSGHYRRARLLNIRATGGVSSLSLQFHNDIVDCIEKKDLQGATQKMKEHLHRLDIKKDGIDERYKDYFENDTSSKGSLDLIDETKLFNPSDILE